MTHNKDTVKSNSELLLATEGVSKSISSKTILQDINLKIHRGQILTLIGPNGAGKTTLIRIILGILKADKGSIYLRPSLRIGYMPQKLIINSTLPITVAGFLRLVRPRKDNEAANLLERLGINHLKGQQITSLSGGEMQRVLLARALLRDPHLLILDEPAQGVDIAGQSKLYDLINEIRAEKGCGILMISHDLHVVMSTTNEVVCLNHHVCCHGKPEDISNDPAFLELFGASSSNNLAIYAHHHNHEHDMTGQIKSSE